jgi:hypothetical protein
MTGGDQCDTLETNGAVFRVESVRRRKEDERCGDCGKRSAVSLACTRVVRTRCHCGLTSGWSAVFADMSPDMAIADWVA